MTQTTSTVSAPLAPNVKLSLPARLKAARRYHTGGETARDTSGPVAIFQIGPKQFGFRGAFVSSPQGIHDMLAGTDSAIDKEALGIQQSRVWGLNSFNLANMPWLPRRRTLQPVFTKRHVADYAGKMVAAADAVAATWTATPERTVDLDKQMRALTLQAIGTSVFGLDLGERASEFGEHLGVVTRWVSGRSLRPVRAPMWLPTPARSRFRASLAWIRTVLDEAIAACRADDAHPADLIRQLLAAHGEDGRPLTDEQIRDELFIFAFAGHDTTSTSLTYAFWELGRNPRIQNRVAAEVAALGDRPLTVADIPSLTYTGQVFHEALRLCPPAAVVVRMAMTDVVVGGYRIPAGTNLLACVYAVHRDPALWESPTSFDPDRFAPQRMKSIDRWQYLPFGAGPRTCIGSHFATLEAVLALAVIRAAEVTSLDNDFPVTLPFTMTAAGPVMTRITCRDIHRGKDVRR